MNGITFQDTNEMDAYERAYVLEKLIEMRKDENDAKQRALDNINKNK